MVEADAHGWRAGLHVIWRITRIGFATPWAVAIAMALVPGVGGHKVIAGTMSVGRLTRS
jgi:hypothetical protein